MAITAAELVARISVTGASQAQSEIAGMGTAVEGAGSKLGLLAGGVALAAGAALVGLGVKSVKMAGDFQSSMTALMTGAGESAANLKMVSDGILKMAVSTGTSTKDLASAMFLVESSGYRAGQGLQVLQAAAQGAKVEHADLTQTTDVLTTSLHDYRLSASQAVPVMNSLITTVKYGKMHMDDLNSSLTNILPVSGALKVKLSDVEGALATMAAGGDRGAAAGTHLSMMLKVLAQPASAATKEMTAMGISSKSVAETMRTSLPGALQMIQDAVAKHFVPGSVEYNRAISTILGGSKSGIAGLELMGQNLSLLQDNAKAAAASMAHAGTAVQGWADVQKDFNQKMDQAKGVVEGFGIKIGSALLPILGKVVDFLIGPALTALTQFGTQVGKELGPAFQQIGKWLASVDWTSVGQQVAQLVLDFSPLGETIQAVIRHGKDLTDWFNNDVKPAIDKAKPGFKQLGDALAGLGPAFKQIGDAVHGNFQKAFDALLPVFKQVVPIVIQIAGALAGGLGTAIKFLTPYIVQAATAIAQFAGDIATRVAPIVSGFFKELNKDMPALKAIWNTIWPALSTSLQAVWNGIVGTIKIAWALVKGIIEIGLDLLSGNWKQAWEDFKTMLAGVWDGIKTIFSGAIQQLVLGFKPLFQMLANVPGPVGDMAKNVLKSMDTMNAGVSDKALQMKVRVLQSTEDMHLQAAKKMDVMRKELIQKMNDTADPVQKKALDMKIKTLTHMEDMQVQASQKADTMKRNVLQKMQDMNDQAVGHSIIPDMVGSITTWFGTLVTNITGKAGSFFSAGVAVVQGVINGINSMIGNVATAISGVAQTIADHLPHSPAKKGPLSKLNEFGPALVTTFAHGIESSTFLAHDAAAKLATSTAKQMTFLANPLTAASLSGATGSTARAFVGIGGERLNFSVPAGVNVAGVSPAVSSAGVRTSVSSGSNGQPIEVKIYMDGKQTARVVLPHIVAAVRNGTGTLL